ncbi:S9 family peptidase [Paenibacillus donghaensis]|uniref:Peptidase S9 family protein n=1 Tax=Paenibacillus donghaensis TaxID=414771 RepID=A0A2Z2KE36_9BACL|nr:S9 family peptidase [Paenibacillus donghaensis]ASA21370.1 peptidase S9 family protein [Paenibacillus donghaensis]
MSTRPILPEDLYQFHWISSPSVHRDGAVACVHTSIDKDKNDYLTQLHIIAPDGRGESRLTLGDQDSAPAWSPNGSQLAFVRIAEGRKQLWTVPAGGGEETQRTAIKRGVGGFVWSPDGKYIAFTSRISLDAGREDMSIEEYIEQSGRVGRSFERTTPKAEGSGWWDGMFSHLYVVELDTNTVSLVTSGAWDATGPEWSPDSTAISFISKQVEEEEADADLLQYADVYTVSRTGGQPVKITDSSLAVSQLAYSLDGNQLYLIASDRTYGSGSHNRLYTVAASGGSPGLLVPGLDMQLGNFALNGMKSAVPSRSPQVVAADGREWIYVLGTMQGSVHVYRFSPDGTYEPVTSGKGRDIYQYTLSADGHDLVFAALEASGPGELYRLNVQTGEEHRITGYNDEILAELQVNLPEEFIYTSSDGLRLQGWIIKPAGLTADKQIPLILHIHGGPHAMITGAYSHEMQTLAAQGYAVLLLNPRGSFGYGQDFAKACRGDFGGGDCQDLLDGVDEALKRYDYTDAARLGIAGGSYGGLMTNWIIAHSGKFRAAVSQRCISNWLSFYGLSDIGISYTEGIVGGNPAENPGLLWSKSPLAHAHRVETPLLLMHGENDFRCPVGQAEEFYTALKRLGKTAKLIRYPGSNHSLLKLGKPSLRVDSFEQVNAWFHDYLRKGEEEQ